MIYRSEYGLSVDESVEISSAEVKRLYYRDMIEVSNEEPQIDKKCGNTRVRLSDGSGWVSLRKKNGTYFLKDISSLRQGLLCPLGHTTLEAKEVNKQGDVGECLVCGKQDCADHFECVACGKEGRCCYLCKQASPSATVLSNGVGDGVGVGVVGSSSSAEALIAVPTRR